MMFLYEVYGYECHCILVHEKGYTKEEFAQMCKEAPLGGDSEYSYYFDEWIIEHLINNYGLKKLK
jgi:hypothetical protein